MSKLDVVIATDCGSTTTKAILIERQPEGTFRQTFRGESPTTVESPFEDVTRGVLNSIQEIEELSGRKILNGEKILTPANDNHGVDLFISTSSAGGGLQMMVAGVVGSMTGESAQRCALGAGAIVMDVLAANDRRLPHQKIERIRQLRPDMFLLSGGTDGGTVSHVVELAEFIAAADPKPRFGNDFELPVIYAGNRDVREQIKETLGDKTALTVTENLRPNLERENLQPARQVIHDLFLEHVMAQAPGYSKLMEWTDTPIMPTPAAVGSIIQTVAHLQDIDVIGVDIGGATTDVFSVFRPNKQEPDARAENEPIFNRSVSANLGMSYSIANVLNEAGLENTARWLPFELDETDLRDRIKNKMIRPTTIPQEVGELQIEHAVAREALRMAFVQHIALAVELKGIQSERTLSDVFEQSASGKTLIDMMALDLLVGSGGVLSHSPLRVQAAAMLIDALQPTGITRLAVDSIFMMPHLGVLSELDEQAATDVFEHDCLIYLGSCIAPVGNGKPGEPCCDYALTCESIPTVSTSGQLRIGEILRIDLGADYEAKLSLMPEKHWDVGAGNGNRLETTVCGGVVGIVLDARGRPIQFDVEPASRQRQIRTWNDALGTYGDRT